MPKSTSIVWKHFQRILTATARCNSCTTEVRCSGNIANLTLHLKRKQAYLVIATPVSVNTDSDKTDTTKTDEISRKRKIQVILKSGKNLNTVMYSLLQNFNDHEFLNISKLKNISDFRQISRCCNSIVLLFKKFLRFLF